MPKKILIFPFGGNAKESLISILAINSIRKEWVIVGFIDDNRSAWDKTYYGIKVKGGREILKQFPDSLILAVPGNPGNYFKRRDIIEGLGVKKSCYATIVDPSAVVSPDARIGYNTLIMANVVISCGVKVGNHCIILPNTVISHDSAIGEYCCVGSNVSVSGNVSIESECYIGSGVSIREDICIGEKSLIGIGSNVVFDIKDGVVAVGNPAKVMRKAIL